MQSAMQRPARKQGRNIRLESYAFALRTSFRNQMGKHRENKRKPVRTGETITVGKAESVPPGRGATVKLKDGTELALYNIGGTFHAI